MEETSQKNGLKKGFLEVGNEDYFCSKAFAFDYFNTGNLNNLICIFMYA